MEQPPSPMLDYASPPKRGQHDPAVWPSLKTLAIGLIWQALLACTDVKLTPGGPFISIHAEVVPILLCLAILTTGIRSLLSGTPRRRVIVAMIMAVSVLFGLGTLSIILSYWRAPYSRGVLIGF